MTVLNPNPSPEPRPSGPRWLHIAWGAFCLTGALIALSVNEPALLVLFLVLLPVILWRPRPSGPRRAPHSKRQSSDGGADSFVWVASGSDAGTDSSNCGDSDASSGGGDCGGGGGDG